MSLSVGQPGDMISAIELNSSDCLLLAMLRFLCLLTHRWDKRVFDRSAFYYRTCKRCGKIQRGIYNTWEIVRERAYVKSEQLGIVRRPSTRLDRLAHTLRLRRTRANDRTVSGRHSEKRKDRRVDTAILVFLEDRRGVTRDISASGAYFWTSGRYAVGESIRFTMARNTANGRMISRCDGHVLRTEPYDYMVGVAASIKESTAEAA